MSLYVLDTDVLSLYRLNHVQVCSRVDAQVREDLAITVMTVEEQLSGWYSRVRKAKNPKDTARAYQALIDSVSFLAGWQMLSFTEPAISRFNQLKTLKANIGGMDLAIAANTLEHGGILVSRNLRDFQRVPGLTVENWAV